MPYLTSILMYIKVLQIIFKFFEVHGRARGQKLVWYFYFSQGIHLLIYFIYIFILWRPLYLLLFISEQFSLLFISISKSFVKVTYSNFLFPIFSCDFFPLRKFHFWQELYSLFLQKASKSDSGDYKCSVKNKWGNDHTTFNLG